MVFDMNYGRSITGEGNELRRMTTDNATSPVPLEPDKLDDLREALQGFLEMFGAACEHDNTYPWIADEVDELLTLLRQHGVGRLDENQTLPIPKDCRFYDSVAYKVGQLDMWEVGFRRVRKL